MGASGSQTPRFWGRWVGKGGRVRDSWTPGEEGAEGPDSRVLEEESRGLDSSVWGPGFLGPEGGGGGGPDSRVSGERQPVCSRGAQPFLLGILLLVLSRHACVVRGRTAVTSPGLPTPCPPRGSRAPPSRVDVAGFGSR